MTGESHRLADSLRKSLEDDILAGRLTPGQRLDEMSLARRFGVSRTPVREALTQLASSGLVETRPRQGAVVAAISARQLVEMFEVMAELEAFCARLATRRMTAAEQRNLQEALAACRAAASGHGADPDAYYDHNERFHEAIYTGSHNEVLADQTRGLRNRLQPYRRRQLARPGRVATSLAEHEAVVAAILAGDPERAAQAMRSHVSIQGEAFTDLMSVLPPGAERRAG